MIRVCSRFVASRWLSRRSGARRRTCEVRRTCLVRKKRWRAPGASSPRPRSVALAKFYQAALGIALVQTRVTLPNVVSFAAGECRQWSSGKGSVPEFRHSQFLIPELARLELALLKACLHQSPSGIGRRRVADAGGKDEYNSFVRWSRRAGCLRSELL